MSLRAKTIQYPFFQATSSIESASLYSSETITLYVTETGSRTFKNVFADVFWRDAVGNTALPIPNVVTQSFYIQLGNGEYFTSSISRSLADSGESVSYAICHDLTDYFSSSFGNNISQSCNYKFHFLGDPITASLPIVGLSTVLNITYQYDDTNATIRSKTVHIPLGNTSSLTNVSLIDITPALDTYCPEISKSFDAIWFEGEVNLGVGAATPDAGFTMSLDSDPYEYGYFIECAFISSPYERWVWVKNNMDTSTTHHLFLGCNNKPGLAMPITLKATYRYNHDESNTILNSVYVPFESVPITTATSHVGEFPRQHIMLSIQEPDPIVTKNCAIGLFFTKTASSQVYTVLGYPPTGGNYWVWLPSAPSVEMTSTFTQQRCDEDDPKRVFGTNVFVTMSRGNNIITKRHTNTISTRYGSFHAYFLANYHSGKHPLGDGVHNHTQIELAATMNEGRIWDTTAAFAFRSIPLRYIPTIPDETYYLNGVSIIAYDFDTVNAVTEEFICAFDVTGSDGAVQYQNAYKPTVCIWEKTDAEMGVIKQQYNFTDYFDRYNAGAANKKMNIRETNRRLFLGVDNCSPLFYTTYHQIAYEVSGSISGYTGDGSGIVVECIESGSNDLNEGKVFITETTAGGQFSGKVYNDTSKYYVVARQSDVLVGRSNDATGSMIV